MSSNRSPGRGRFLRFLMAGGLNTAFGFAVYSTAIAAGCPVWAALLVSNVTGVAFNFFTTGGYAFRSLLLSRFPRFAAAYALIYLINWALIHALQPWVRGVIVAQALLVVPMALLSYLIMARFVFAAEPATPAAKG